MIRAINPSDAEAVCSIYNYYVLHTIITFEEEPVSVLEMQQRIHSITQKHPWLVYETEGQIVGYAYASDWKSRVAYRYSVESSVYLRPTYTGKGIGSKLYEALITEISKTETHAVIGGIAIPNESSIILHEKFGFKKVAHFPQVGYKFKQWIDVAYWQKTLKEI